MQTERRAHPRHSMMRPATIKLDQGREIRCILRNVSKAGAMISLEDDYRLPGRFVLDLSGNILVERLCDLVWQDKKVAGVKFPPLKKFQSIQFDRF